MIALPIDIALLRATFPDWRIIEGRQACFAIKRADALDCSRFAALGRPMLAAGTLAALAIQLAALEFPQGITPTS